MKKQITIILLLLSNSILFAQASKTFVKSFPIQVQTVLLDLDGPVQIEIWDEPFIRVHTSVSLEKGNSEVLKSLMMLGRYRVESSGDGADFVLASASRRKRITYQGSILKERVEYTVFVPRYVEVKEVKRNLSMAILQKEVIP